MATFIPNVTDVFPERLQFKPDFNRVERGLMLRSNAYSEGARKVKSIYDSVFQSPMLRDGNVERRDAYLREITEGLKNASSMDLSILQNQQTTMRLFEPLQNDKNIVKDIMFTKNYTQQLSKAEEMRSSSNPETRRQYWDTGVKYMQYKAEEFKNADETTAMSMSNVSYIPNVDMVSIANKMYKDMGISVKQDVISGGYIWTKKNGDLAIPLTQSVVNTMFANDPAIQDMLKVQAYVERKDFIKSNAARFNGNEQAAEQEYINTILSSIGEQQKQLAIADSEEVKDLRARKDSWNNIIQNRGIIPDSDEHKKYLEDLEKLKAAEAAANGSRDHVTALSTINPDNIDDLRSAADNAVIFANYNSSANRIATLLAYKDAESTAKADPIYMAQLNSNLSLNRSLVLENVRQINKVAFMDEQLKRGITPGSGGTKRRKEDGKRNEQQLFNNLFGGTPLTGGSSNTQGSSQTTEDKISVILDKD
jgi:hypothetical protein